jgi:uncharacterized protein (DUF1015 family)/phosphoribosylanthranilate isomerase
MGAIWSRPGVVQVAGIRDLEEARMLLEAGVPLLGFPLRLDFHDEDMPAEEVARIVGLLGLERRGVVVTYLTQPGEIVALLQQTGLRTVQLHGQVSPEALLELRKSEPRLFLIKSLIVRTNNFRELQEEISSLDKLVDAFLTDSFDPGTGASGATGRTHDWSISRRLAQSTSRPLILAGGLTPQNVFDAILSVEPFGVDAHTGLERPDGRKDREKVMAFLSQAKQGFTRCSALCLPPGPRWTGAARHDAAPAPSRGQGCGLKKGWSYASKGFSEACAKQRLGTSTHVIDFFIETGRKELTAMAEIAPFQGLRYNPKRIPDLSQVVIPPYDVISPREQEAFYECNPYNMIRLELGKAAPEDNETANPHTRAASYLHEWQSSGVLIREDRPVLYYYELDYTIGNGLKTTRYGFLCLLRLEGFESGLVRPHERTFQAVKDERLKLMLACHANLSSVFALYSDPHELVDRSLKKSLEAEPIMAFRDREGMGHRIWRVSDEQAFQNIQTLMRDKAIFIADGHHRYETALNYRAIQRERHPNAGEHAPFEYIMVYLSNLNQGGLTILPTHRLLRHLPSWSPDAFLQSAAAYFDIEEFEASEVGRAQWAGALDAARPEQRTVIGFHSHPSRSCYLFKTRSETVVELLERCSIPAVLCGLDVVVLDEVLLKKLLALPDGFLADSDNIHFKHNLEEAVNDVCSGRYEAGFFINPTRIEQVQEVASAGLIMPHKSTYFYPKVGSGMVIHPILPHERVHAVAHS